MARELTSMLVAGNKDIESGSGAAPRGAEQRLPATDSALDALSELEAWAKKGAQSHIGGETLEQTEMVERLAAYVRAALHDRAHA
jgi:hypothetical protein